MNDTSCRYCGATGHRADDVPDRPAVQGEAERLLGYWEIHQNSPEAVAKWAMEDLMGFLRLVVAES